MNGKFYRFKITGRGKIPFQLLSIEQCFPETGVDAENAFESYFSGSHRTIAMRSYKVPNASLWMSYGWSVSGIPASLVEKDDYNIYHTWPC